jgi:hypothetical protein
MVARVTEQRPVFFVAALLLMLLAVCLELGSAATIRTEPVPASAITGPINELGVDPADVRDQVDGLESENPPGLAIPSMALFDGLAFYSLLVMALALVIPGAVLGRIQGIATLLVSLALVIASVIVTVLAVISLLFLVALFLATPFGTITYLALFGFFNRGAAQATLAFVFVAKLAACVCLALAHRRNLQTKGLVTMMVVSLVLNVIVSLLHGIVPLFLVSITDALAAIVVGIIGLLWSIFMLIGGVIAVVKAIIGFRAGRQHATRTSRDTAAPLPSG